MDPIRYLAGTLTWDCAGQADERPRHRPGPVASAAPRGAAPGIRANRSPGHAVVSQQGPPLVNDAVALPADLCQRLLRQAAQIHRAGLKSYGLLTAEPGAAGYPLTATGVVFLDSRKNRRNEPGHRAAFRAQGEYFRQFDDAGFVADPSELLAVFEAIEDSGAQVVAPFHSHRRQPANFSLIDYRLHNPAFAWHLIISLRDPLRPVVQPFRVRKELSDFGITAQDDGQGSELAYQGPEVEPLALVAYGPRSALDRLMHTMHPQPGPAGAGSRERPSQPSDLISPAIPAPAAARPGAAA